MPSCDAVAVLQPIPRLSNEPTGAGNGVVGWAHWRANDCEALADGAVAFWSETTAGVSSPTPSGRHGHALAGRGG